MTQKQWEQREQEYHFIKGAARETSPGTYASAEPEDADGDTLARIHHYDNEEWYTVEAYDRRIIKKMREYGAQELPSELDGALFQVNTKQLIYFLGRMDNIPVDFPSRWPARLSKEQKQARQERGRALAAEFSTVSSGTNDDF